jgi:hypothetical protein
MSFVLVMGPDTCVLLASNPEHTIHHLHFLLSSCAFSMSAELVVNLSRFIARPNDVLILLWVPSVQGNRLLGVITWGLKTRAAV